MSDGKPSLLHRRNVLLNGGVRIGMRAVSHHSAPTLRSLNHFHGPQRNEIIAHQDLFEGNLFAVNPFCPLTSVTFCVLSSLPLIQTMLSYNESFI
jgi:hypothetical protein